MRVIYHKDPFIKGVVKELIPEPVVIRLGEITDEAAKDFSMKMTDAYNTGQEIIPVVIDSYGGSAYSLLSILSDIESSRLPIATISVGKSMSAGAILLAHGTPGLRFADPNSTVMLHEVSSWNFGKLSEMQANIEEVARLNYVLFSKLAAACGHKDLKYFNKLMEKKHNVDWYMDVFEAKKLKIVDHIGVPEFHVEILKTINFVFEKPDIDVIE